MTSAEIANGRNVIAEVCATLQEVNVDSESFCVAESIRSTSTEIFSEFPPRADQDVVQEDGPIHVHDTEEPMPQTETIKLHRVLIRE
jgi:hypothetical protein